MKNLLICLFALAVVCSGVFSCQKTLDQSNPTQRDSEQFIDEACAGPYDVELLHEVMVTGGWLWTWKITNPNPGNGDDGTVQGLSHVNLILASSICLVPPEGEDPILLGAEWSQDGETWVSVSTDPVVDPSIINACNPDLNIPSIKFGISGNTGYFRILVSKNFTANGVMTGYYKSGENTGCGEFCFEGINCLEEPPPPPPEIGCSMSQGFWFAKPLSEINAWPGGGVTMGGKAYTAVEARSLWGISGNIELKRAFTQAATIKLSLASGLLLDASAVQSYVDNIDGVLNGLPKLTPGNLVSVNRSLPSAIRKSLSQWAGGIGSWIDLNHCETTPPY